MQSAVNSQLITYSLTSTYNFPHKVSEGSENSVLFAPVLFIPKQQVEQLVTKLLKKKMLPIIQHIFHLITADVLGL
jgi:hypothetical protein